jgi:hypothetical protein
VGPAEAQNLLVDLADAGTRVKLMIHERDASFTSAFDVVAGRYHSQMLPVALSPFAQPLPSALLMIDIRSMGMGVLPDRSS